MDSPHARNSAREWLPRVLWLLVFTGLAVYLAFSLWLGLAGLVFPYQLDYGEGIVLWFAQQLAHGHSIYKGLTGLPYASSNYPPLSMLLAAILMPIFGEGYTAGRLLNFASALVVAALIYRIVSLETHKRPVGALAALFFVGSPYIYHWIPLFRADLLGLAFAFGGIYAIWAAESQPHDAQRRRRYLMLAMGLFLLALFTKQTLFAAPAAAFLALFQRNRRVAIIFGAALVSIGGIVYLVLDFATAGGFTFGLLTSNATVFMPEQLIILLKNYAEMYPVILMLALFGLIQRVRHRRVRVLDWYVVTSTAGLFMAGRTGAWENYFFEAIASASVLAGIAVGNWLPIGRSLPARTQPRADSKLDTNVALVVVVPLLLLLQIVIMRQDPRIALDMMTRDLTSNRELATLLASTPGTIISEDMGALATSGKEVAYYTFQYSSLARSGQWDQSWELNGLSQGKFPLVILEQGTREDVDHYRRFTREFVSSLDQYYDRVKTIGKYELYSPAPLAHYQSINFGDSIAMVGWSVVPLSFEPSTAQFTIVWQAQRAMGQRYKAFVHLVNERGKKITQDDKEPHQGEYPTTRWAPGEMVREVYVLEFPPAPPAGKYKVYVGWYDLDSGDRLPVAGGADDSVALMSFEVPASK